MPSNFDTLEVDAFEASLYCSNGSFELQMTNHDEDNDELEGYEKNQKSLSLEFAKNPIEPL